MSIKLSAHNIESIICKLSLLKAEKETFYKDIQILDKTNHHELSRWVKKYEPKTRNLLDQTRLGMEFGYQPLISVILPIYRVSRDILNQTLVSLECQTYCKWEACIVWSDIEDDGGLNWIIKRTSSDKRFKIRALKANGGISKNSNDALEAVNGEFIALLDHDDMLSAWAFYEVVRLLQTEPDLDFIYSDKDSIDAEGKIRLNALYKPEWSPEMLHSVNYLTHLNIIRTVLVRDVGGWRPQTDGAQDWDLFYRVTEKTNKIRRIPSILYHWRIHPTSTSSGLEAKPYAALGQLRSHQDHFKRMGLPATVSPTDEGLFHISWPVERNTVDIFVYQSGGEDELINILNILRFNKQETINYIYVIYSHTCRADIFEFSTVWPNKIAFIESKESKISWDSCVRCALEQESLADNILILDGAATGISNALVEELSGWLNFKNELSWVSALVLNPNGIVHEAGRLMGSNGASAPLLSGEWSHAFGWFGGPKWYRNTSTSSPYAFAFRSKDIHLLDNVVDDINNKTTRNKFDAACVTLNGENRRGLINPFALVYFDKPPETGWFNEGSSFYKDPYFNPSFSQVSPLRLNK